MCRRAGLRYWVADTSLYIRIFIGTSCYRICDCETNFSVCLDLSSADFYNCMTTDITLFKSHSLMGAYKTYPENFCVIQDP